MSPGRARESAGAARASPALYADVICAVERGCSPWLHAPDDRSHVLCRSVAHS